ncbi:MAG TPA: ATP-binding cassette domain-containing protein [Microlunatus sp.]|nr:ATP-binding cassette domain-containing protein [Microlunatus sp.]
MTSSPSALAVQDLTVEYGRLPVLRGVGLEVHAGETVTLLGGNGAGKSTLVRAVLGLTPHQRGEVRLFGTPLARFSAWRRIGHVPQRSTAALSNALVREVVAAGRLARRVPFVPSGRADRAAVTAALESVGMADRARDELRWLSGGQQQRVLIARALASEPDLLVLDEPNAGVDLEHQRILAGLLSALVERGVGILVVLHEVGPLAPVIDRAVLLRHGRVVHDGPLGSLGQSHRHHGHHAGTIDGPVPDGTLLDGSLLGGEA